MTTSSKPEVKYYYLENEEKTLSFVRADVKPIVAISSFARINRIPSTLYWRLTPNSAVALQKPLDLKTELKEITPTVQIRSRL